MPVLRVRPLLPPLAAILLVVGLAACSGAPARPAATATVSNGTVTVVADDLAFDVGTITAPAGEPFVIRMENAEAVAHNVSVYTEEGGEVIVLGEIVTGPGAVTETPVPALEPGTYFWVCDVHPTQMTGTLVVEG